MIEEAGVLVWDVKYHSGQPWVSFRHLGNQKPALTIFVLFFFVFLALPNQPVYWFLRKSRFHETRSN